MRPSRAVPLPVVLAGLFGGDGGWGVIAAATAGVPLYVCGGASVGTLTI